MSEKIKSEMISRRGALLLGSAAVSSLVVPAAMMTATDAAPRAQHERGKIQSRGHSAQTFAPASFWYQEIPTGAMLHPNSAGFAAEFAYQVTHYYGHVSFNIYSYSSPLYIVDANTLTVPVTCTASSPGTLAQQWAAVPIPDHAVPASGTDAKMTIFQPSYDTMWEFQGGTTKDPVTGEWSSRWGGRMGNVSQSNGIWPYPYGGTATGLPMMGGLVTVEELQRGSINHAVGMALVRCEDRRIFSWPANRSDGVNSSGLPNQIPEGIRCRIDPSINLDALGLHPVALMIARAGQTFGFVIWDKTASVVALCGEDPKSYTQLGQPDPWVALLAGKHQYDVLNGIPWGQMQFLPMDYGKP